MNQLENRVMRSLTWEEMQALMDMGKLLEKAFGYKVYKITVTGDTMDPTKVHGVMVSFNFNEG